MEIGPYRVKDEDTLVENEGSWHEFANLLFVDNPVGTGFSYVDTNKFIHELDKMADNFVTFLEKFFEMFPHYEEDDVSSSVPIEPIPYTDAFPALLCRRVLRRPTHPLYCARDPRPK